MQPPYYDAIERIFILAIRDRDFYFDLMRAIDDAGPTSTMLKEVLTDYNSKLQIDSNTIDELQDGLNERADKVPQFKAECERFYKALRDFIGEENLDL